MGSAGVRSAPGSTGQGRQLRAKQAGRSGLQNNVFMAWYRHTSLTNFIIQQSRSFEGVWVPLRLTNCSPYPQLSTYGDQSPLYGTVFRSITHLLRHFPSSAVS